MKKGFGLDLFKFSRCLSVAGICVSIVGVIGGIANLVIIASSEDIAFIHFPKLFYGAGAVILIFTMLYLAPSHVYSAQDQDKQERHSRH